MRAVRRDPRDALALAGPTPDRTTLLSPRPLAAATMTPGAAFKKAMKLPGSRFDILREANVPGPSPVGGSKGGTTGRAVQTLDEFELQAVHYNMACCHAALEDAGACVVDLRQAFAYGFDNYSAVRGDSDLRSVRGTQEFERLMDEVDPKFNPFGLFGK